MRFTAIFLIALISLNAVQSVSLRKNSEGAKTSFALERLRFIGKKSTIARQIVSAVELHLTSGGRFAEVIELVEQAKNDVSARRDTLQAQYTEQRTTLENIIGETQSQLDTNNARLQFVNENISRLNGEIQDLTQAIQSYENQLENLRVREETVNEARDIDIKSYATRQQRDTNSLNVLSVVIQKLKALAARGPVFLQVSKKEIQRALNRIPKSNPIQALVQLSTKFDPETLNNVISKLESVQNAIQASSEEDRRGEEQSEAHYNALIAEIQVLRAQTQQSLDEAREKKDKAEGELAQFENERVNLELSIQQDNEKLALTKQELENVIASFEHRINEAGEAIQAIQQAIEVLQQNANQLQEREDVSDIIEEYSS